MTMPDPAAARKPPRRFWLFAPYAAAAVCVVLWSLFWVRVRAEVAARMDHLATDAEIDGFDLNWRASRIGGYPFRIEVTLEGAHMGEPSGWGLAAPQLKAVANAYDLNHWVIAAGQGVVLTRPSAGATAITGQAIRMSWVGQGRAAPRIVVEGRGLTFTPRPGAKPFPLARAARAAFYTRPAAGDRVEAGLQLYDAWANPASRLNAVTGQRSIAAIWQGVIDHVAAFRGADASSAARAWANAGGSLSTTFGGAAAGGRALGVGASRLSLDPDGRLSGEARLELTGGPGAVRALGGAGALDPSAADAAAELLGLRGAGGKAWTDLTFQAGQTTLGPVAVAAAPKPF